MVEVRGSKIVIEGLSDLQLQFDRLGKMPKKYLTKSAKAGSDGPLKDAKSLAPKGKTGLLKRGLQRKMETPNKRNKSVYRIRWNPKFTEQYLKDSSGAYGGKPPKAYYPHSVEYGFKTKKGYRKGRYFVTKAIEQNEKQSLQKMVDSLSKSINEILNI